MPALTKTQVENLSADQQATLAEVELRLAQKRQKLLKQARGCRSIFFGIIPLLLLILPFLYSRASRASTVMPMVLFVGLFAVIQFQALYINRRLDALLELLNLDVKGISQAKE